MQLLQLNKCRELTEAAEASLREGTSCYYGIEACNEVLDGHSNEIGKVLRFRCLCTRAALLLKVSVNLLSSMIQLLLVPFSM